MPRFGHLYNIISGRTDPYWISIAKSIAGLILVYYLDQLAGRWSMIFLSVILVIWVANTIGGTYSYVFAAVVALGRVFSPEQSFHFLNDPTMGLWQLFNLLIAYESLTYMICKKNVVLNQLETFSVTDPLTMLLNRRGFLDRLEMALAHAKRHRTEISIAYLDIDNFKNVNDHYGHDAGDMLLKIVATTINDTLRAEDTPSRLGGDEFAIIFPSTSKEHDSYPMINRVKDNLDKNCVGYDVSFSIGIIHYTGKQHVTVGELVQAADQLMYIVKKSTKNAISSRYF